VQNFVEKSVLNIEHL